MAAFVFATAAPAGQLQQCASVAPSMAKLFTYEDMGTYQKVHSTQCDETYILYPRGQAAPSLGSDYKYFGVPLDNVAVTQSVPNTFLESLNVRDKISVASEYSTAACIAKKVADGDAESFVGHSAEADAFATQMGNSAIDAIFSDPWYTSSWPHVASSSKVICEASTYETHPLGSAEWIKFFGYLFGKSTEADAAYCATVSRYMCNSAAATKTNVGSFAVPKVLFTSKDWQGKFSVAMPPYKDQFVHDAGGVYPDLKPFESFKELHWTGTQVTGFKFPAANVTQFHAALQLADVIIAEDWPHGQTMKTIADAYSLLPLRVGQAFLMANDDPAKDKEGWALVSHGVGEKLFTVDSSGAVVPNLASSVVRQSDGAWIVTLAPGRHFSDGSPVTATDVAAALNRTNALNDAYGKSSVGTMTITVLDGERISITTTTATPIMDSVLAEFPFVIYKTLASGRIFTGPYMVESFVDGGSVLHLIPNPHYTNAEARIPIVITKYDSGDAVAAALSAGEIDMGFNLPPTAIPQFTWVKDASVKSYNVGYQYMGFFNTQKAHLADKRVRQALALAIDRPALAAAAAPAGLPAAKVADLVATGPFNSNTLWGSTEVHPRMPTNLTEAAKLLDEAGWLLDGTTNIRIKAGVELALDIVYYKWRADLVAMAPLIRDQLIALGVKATIREENEGDYMTSAGMKMDMLLWAQNTLPSGDPHFFLETFFKTKAPILDAWAGQNFAQYSSSAIDSALDTLATAEGAARTAAAHEAHRIILEEAPATFLSSGIWHVGLNSRMASYEPWGSDYHVIKKEMPKNDWPPAIKHDRVYGLDGTMDANGPPNGGTDWYESRVAEPDAFLTDLIAVLHPAGSNYAPAGMHYLRHISTGTTTSVKPSDCTDPTAPRPVLAATCADLGVTPESVISLSPPPPPRPPPSPSPPPPPSPPLPVKVVYKEAEPEPSDKKDDSDDGGLMVAVIVLAVVAAIALVAAIAVVMYYNTMKKPARSKGTVTDSTA